MAEIFFTSDTHFGHNKEFLYSKRGFSSAIEHGETIVENWNSIVKPGDDVWHLGDLMLSKENEELAKKWVSSLNGNIHLIIGNHDTDARIEMYKNELKNIVSIDFGARFRYNGLSFWMYHYPMYTKNEGHPEDNIKTSLLCLHGHTHQTTNFTGDIKNVYHVGLDSHNNTPVNIEDVIKDFKTVFYK